MPQGWRVWWGFPSYSLRRKMIENRHRSPNSSESHLSFLSFHSPRCANVHMSFVQCSLTLRHDVATRGCSLNKNVTSTWSCQKLAFQSAAHTKYVIPRWFVSYINRQQTYFFRSLKHMISSDKRIWTTFIHVTIRRPPRQLFDYHNGLRQFILAF